MFCIAERSFSFAFFTTIKICILESRFKVPDILQSYKVAQSYFAVSFRIVDSSSLSPCFMLRTSCFLGKKPTQTKSSGEAIAYDQSHSIVFNCRNRLFKHTFFHFSAVPVIPMSKMNHMKSTHQKNKKNFMRQ